MVTGPGWTLPSSYSLFSFPFFINRKEDHGRIKSREVQACLLETGVPLRDVFVRNVPKALCFTGLLAES